MKKKNKMPIDIRYYLSCGCIKWRSEIKKITNRPLPSGEKYTGLICCDHKFGIAVYRITKCLDCGCDLFPKNLTGRYSERCDKHKKIRKDLVAIKHHSKKAGEELIEIKKTEYKKHKTRGDYCRLSRTCERYPECLDCEKFYPIFRGVDPGRGEQWAI